MFKNVKKWLAERKARNNARVKKLTLRQMVARLEKKVEDFAQETQQNGEEIYSLKHQFEGIEDVNCGELESRLRDIEYRLDDYDPEQTWDKAVEAEEKTEYLDNEVDDLRDRCDDLEGRLEELENYGNPEDQEHIAKLSTDTTEHFNEVDARIECLEVAQKVADNVQAVKNDLITFFLKLDIKPKDKKAFCKIVKRLEELQ